MPWLGAVRLAGFAGLRGRVGPHRVADLLAVRLVRGPDRHRTGTLVGVPTDADHGSTIEVASSEELIGLTLTGGVAHGKIDVGDGTWTESLRERFVSVQRTAGASFGDARVSAVDGAFRFRARKS